MQREGENLPKELELSPVNIKTRSPALNLSAPLINYVQEMPPIIKESKIEVTNLLPKKEICQDESYLSRKKHNRNKILLDEVKKELHSGTIFQNNLEFSYKLNTPALSKSRSPSRKAVSDGPQIVPKHPSFGDFYAKSMRNISNRYSGGHPKLLRREIKGRQFDIKNSGSSGYSSQSSQSSFEGPPSPKSPPTPKPSRSKSKSNRWLPPCRRDAGGFGIIDIENIIKQGNSKANLP